MSKSGNARGIPSRRFHAKSTANVKNTPTDEASNILFKSSIETYLAVILYTRKNISVPNCTTIAIKVLDKRTLDVSGDIDRLYRSQNDPIQAHAITVKSLNRVKNLMLSHHLNLSNIFLCLLVIYKSDHEDGIWYFLVSLTSNFIKKY